MPSRIPIPISTNSSVLSQPPMPQSSPPSLPPQIPISSTRASPSSSSSPQTYLVRQGQAQLDLVSGNIGVATALDRAEGVESRASGAGDTEGVHYGGWVGGLGEGGMGAVAMGRDSYSKHSAVVAKLGLGRRWLPPGSRLSPSSPGTTWPGRIGEITCGGFDLTCMREDVFIRSPSLYVTLKENTVTNGHQD